MPAGIAMLSLFARIQLGLTAEFCNCSNSFSVTTALPHIAKNTFSSSAVVYPALSMLEQQHEIPLANMLLQELQDRNTPVLHIGMDQ